LIQEKFIKLVIKTSKVYVLKSKMHTFKFPLPERLLILFAVTIDKNPRRSQSKQAMHFSMFL